MGKQIYSKFLASVFLAATLLSSCDGISFLIPQVTDTDVKKEFISLESSKFPMQAKIEIINNAANIPANKRLIKITLTVPRDPLRRREPEGFVIKALPVDSIVKLKAEVSGIGITSPIQPDATTSPALVDGYVPVNYGTASINFVVPVGLNRIVTLTAYDSASQIITNAAIKGVLNVTDTGINTVDITEKTTPTAATIENLITSNPLIASLIDYTQLQTYIDNNLNGNHPSLLKPDVLANEINTVNSTLPPGDTPAMPTNPITGLFIIPVTLNGTVTVQAGYDAGEFTINCYDPSSSYSGFTYTKKSFTAPITINYSIASVYPLTTGSWAVKLNGTFYQYNYPRFRGTITSSFDTITSDPVNFAINPPGYSN